jgi:hypothetical protein
MSGFITLQRGAIDHPLFKGEPARLGAWCWLLAKAVWKESRFDIGGKTITLQRGQLCVSRAQLSEAWSMSPSAVERFLTRLQAEEMISRETGQGRSIITIGNYSKYQGTKDGAGQADGSNATRTGGRSKTGQATGQAELALSIDEHSDILGENEAPGQATGQRSDSDRTTKEQGNKETRLEEESYASPSNGAGEDQAADRVDAKPPVDTPPAKPRRKVKPKVDAADVPIPDWMPMEAWNGYLEMRAACGKAPTGRAVELLIKKLDGFRAKGHDPTDALDKSTIEQWTDVYEPKVKANGNQDNRRGAAGSGAGGANGTRPAAGFERRAFEARSREGAGEDGRRGAGEDGSAGDLLAARPRSLPRG